MTKPVVTYPDPERLVVDLLTSLLAAPEPTVTVGVSLPAGYVVDDSPAHIMVACDGTPLMAHPIMAHPTVRIVAYAPSTTRAKALAQRALGLLCAHGGGDGITGITALTGLLPSRDPDTRAELASCTMRVTLRSVPPE